MITRKLDNICSCCATHRQKKFSVHRPYTPPYRLITQHPFATPPPSKTSSSCTSNTLHPHLIAHYATTSPIFHSPPPSIIAHTAASLPIAQNPPIQNPITNIYKPHFPASAQTPHPPTNTRTPKTRVTPASHSPTPQRETSPPIPNTPRRQPRIHPRQLRLDLPRSWISCNASPPSPPHASRTSRPQLAATSNACVSLRFSWCVARYLSTSAISFRNTGPIGLPSRFCFLALKPGARGS